MEHATEFTNLDGLGQAQLVQNREVKPVELVDAAIERIERLNPQINAVIYRLYDEARGLAKDETRLLDGPFRGVPFLIKDLVSVYAGAPMTSGCSYFSTHVPDHDSVLVSRLKRAGLIILGKTNTPELGLQPTTEPRLFGATHNPWNRGRTAGGSSGGSAAAVASRMVPMAHANDGGGSIRIPASCCGIFGLKPTRGRISLGPDAGEIIGGLGVEHAVTISVRDSAALLDATAGPAAGDPYWACPPAQPFLEEVKTPPGRLRIALAKAGFSSAPVHQDCLMAVEEAAKLCSDLGHEVDEDLPKIDGDSAVQMFLTLWAAGCATELDGSARRIGKPIREEQLEPLTWTLYQAGRNVSASQYLLARAELQQISRQIGQFMERYDVLLTPTLGSPPVPLAWFSMPPLDYLEAQQRMIAFAPFTLLFNVTGQPAMSVPLHWNAENLPVGTQFVGRYGGESTLYRLAAQLEAACPWKNRRPPGATTS